MFRSFPHASAVLPITVGATRNTAVSPIDIPGSAENLSLEAAWGRPVRTFWPVCEEAAPGESGEPPDVLDQEQRPGSGRHCRGRAQRRRRDRERLPPARLDQSGRRPRAHRRERRPRGGGVGHHGTDATTTATTAPRPTSSRSTGSAWRTEPTSVRSTRATTTRTESATECVIRGPIDGLLLRWRTYADPNETIVNLEDVTRAITPRRTKAGTLRTLPDSHRAGESRFGRSVYRLGSTAASPSRSRIVAPFPEPSLSMSSRPRQAAAKLWTAWRPIPLPSAFVV